MLFRQRFLDGIQAGTVTVAFRRWKRPTVKAGGTLLTSVGLLAIQDVSIADADDLKAADARKAGFASLDELRADIESQRAQPLYRIRFKLAGADPRLALRENAALTPDDVATLKQKLQRLDSASRHGPWTAATLRAIRTMPGTRAAELADATNMQTPDFKRNVRKLKALGLTESLGTGYRLSPRGIALLRRLPKS